MTKYKRTVILGAAVVSIASLFASMRCFADSLAEKQQQEQWQTKLQDYKQSIAAKCGKNIAVELDTNSWKNVPPDELVFSFADYCGNGCVVGVEMVCANSLGKSAVSEKIDKIICSYQKGDEAKITVGNKTMECRFGLSDMQFQEHTKDVLEKLL